ncbi:MAG: glutathione S-transferase family protein, partial [Geminicoccaceae bacterium]
MGMLVAGQWTVEDKIIQEGAFVRRASSCRQDLGVDIIKALPSEPDRYHLIASLSCPWSHRTLIIRKLMGLEDKVHVQIAGGPRVEGYAVDYGRSWRVPGTDQYIRHVHQLYSLNDPAYTGRATVPLVWDARTGRIVSNSSATIIRAFDAVQFETGAADFTFLPRHLLDEIDAINDDIYRDLSNAVYRAGLAERQEAYDDAVNAVFAMLDRLEERLQSRRYLFGAVITEADWRLFPTLVRFDAVYGTHFRCTRRRLVDYPSLWGYARDLYGWKGIAETVDFSAVLEGYYRYDGNNNPFSIIAALP